MRKVYCIFCLSQIADRQIICLKEMLDTSVSTCIFNHYADYLVNSLFSRSLSLASTHVLSSIRSVNRIFVKLLTVWIKDRRW